MINTINDSGPGKRQSLSTLHENSSQTKIKLQEYPKIILIR